MGLYLITLCIFFASFLGFFLFLIMFFLPMWPMEKVRKILLGLQLVCFAYWNIVFWAYLLYVGHRQPAPFQESAFIEYLAVPGGSGQGGSIFMGYWIFTPIFAAFVIIELLIMRRTAKHKKKAGA